ATAEEDETNWRRCWVNRNVFWQNVWRGRAWRLPWARLARTALRFDGVYAGYFGRSGAPHPRVGERAAARQALGRAVAISPLHVAAAIARQPSALRWMAWALFGFPPQSTWNRSVEG